MKEGDKVRLMRDEVTFLYHNNPKNPVKEMSPHLSDEGVCDLSLEGEWEVVRIYEQCGVKCITIRGTKGSKIVVYGEVADGENLVFETSYESLRDSKGCAK